MKKPLRVLMVEDSSDDAELILRELRRSGYEVSHLRVETAEAMRAALTEREWEVVLSDYTMPKFSATAALALLHDTKLDLPFIIVSGMIGEETAVDSLKAGAHDFIVKGRLARLVPAIEREVREVKVREEHRRAGQVAEEALRERMRAEEASQAKSMFLANMSHELRTPLTAIIGLSEVLADGKVGRLTPPQQTSVNKILMSSQHLLSLINDILDLSKVQAGRMEISREPSSLPAVFEQIREMLEPLAKTQGLTLTVSTGEGLPNLFADPVRLKQILLNLLSNSIKFTPRGGTVLLDAIATGEGISISVHDTGVGIRAEDIPRLFREFEQLDPTGNAAAHGTGLGLALTRKLVELHGGSITVKSEPGHGSVFTVVFPLDPSEPATTQREPSQQSGAAEPARTDGACILVVEDDSSIRLLIQTVLECRGHQVLEASGVDEAREILQERTPQLVLTDIRIPGGGGELLLKEMRQNPIFKELPVVAMTALAIEGNRERLLACGFDGVLLKPIDTREFGPTLESFLVAEASRTHSA
jgi:signal transduction histidine kinase